MNIYFRVMRNTWDEMVMYRLNFFMWRLRNVLQFLTLYFLWVSVIPEGTQIFGYTQSLMITYVMGITFLSAIILSSRTQEIGDNINNGDLSIFLLRPVSYFHYWFFRDIGDKGMNIFLSIIELSLLFLVLHPPIFLQTNSIYLLLTIIAILEGIFLYFFISTLLGLLGFWSTEVWAPRYIFSILVSFFAGGLFPLDILPKNIQVSFQLLPFANLLYFPLKIYLGQLNYNQLLFGFCVGTFWIIGLWLLVKLVWYKGLMVYSAEGR